MDPSIVPSRSSHRRFALPALVVLWTLLGTAGWSTTFVRMSDAELVDRAPVIIEAAVMAIEPAPGVDRPATDYLVEIEHWIKGFLPGSALIVRVPGGVLPDGTGLHILGAPRFTVGERALLFLTPRSDGTFAPYQLFLGTFYRDEVVPPTPGTRQESAGQENRKDPAPGQAQFFRDLSSAHELLLPGSPALPELDRDVMAFRRWIEDRVAGVERPADYLVTQTPAHTKLQRKFKTIISSSEPAPVGCGTNGGHSVRWFDFDQGGSVSWFAPASGQPGLAGDGQAELKAAITAWNDAQGATIRYQRGGPSSASGGLQKFDGVNTLLFGDPNDELSGRFEGSGILALGGPWFTCDLRTYAQDGEAASERFHPILGADVVTQDGLELFFSLVEDPVKAAEELFAHELGHTLGLAHSSEPEALMFAEIHADGRGAALDADDLAAVHFLYAARDDVTPLAPSNLWAAALAANKIRLTWQDNSDDETGFRVEVRLEGVFVEIPFAVPPNTRALNISGLGAATEYAFRVRAVNAFGGSTPTNVARTTTFAAAAPCLVDSDQLCLLGGRFAVRVRYRNQHADGVAGTGKAIPATDQTGFFWFFQEGNTELTVKLLDGTGYNQHFWVLYGGLSDVEYWIEVEDTQTGGVKEYHNPPGRVCGRADTLAFEPETPDTPEIRWAQRASRLQLQGLQVELLHAPPQSPLTRASSAVRDPAAAATPAGCSPTNERLCLLDGRFSVEVGWKNQHAGGIPGFGRAVAGSDNTGYFWFFNAANLELVIKVLDGRGYNQHFWVFYGALSDVEYEIRVKDTQTGELHTYLNPPGEICGQADTHAFPVAPPPPP